MAVHLIIDGYNLLGAGSRSRTDRLPWSEAAREELLRRLSGYRLRRGHAITVVFDGWRVGGHVEHHEHRGGVEVIYSRRGEQADQVIRRLAAEYGKDGAVVSSDREVGDSARAAGALVIPAPEFLLKLVEAPLQSAARPFKELDSEQPSEMKRGPDKKGNPRKLPKSLRKRRRQLRGF